jgi:hypothetical protein
MTDPKLSDVLVINDQNELKPKIDVKEVFNGIFGGHTPNFNYLQYEKASRGLGFKPSSLECVEGVVGNGEKKKEKPV